MTAKLDDKGRCCGRKPIFYKGGSWRSPQSAPMHFCGTCCREYGPDGEHRPNWAWVRQADGQFSPITIKAREAVRASEPGERA